MSPASMSRSRSLFTSAMAFAMGLQVAPWPTSLSDTIYAQDKPPVRLVMPLGQAAHIHTVGRRTQRRSNASSTPQSVQPPQLQPMPQQGAPNAQTATPQQIQKSEVQLELEKLYQKDGRELPQMIDPRTSQPYNGQQSPEADQTGRNNARQHRLQQPQVQPQSAQSQTVSPTPPAAPKKRGLLSKWFMKDEAPTQPPVEPAYTPPRQEMPLTPPAIVSGGVAPQTGIHSNNAPYQQPVNDSSPAVQDQFAPPYSQVPAQQTVPQQSLSAPQLEYVDASPSPTAAPPAMRITPAPGFEDAGRVLPTQNDSQLDAPLYGELTVQDSGSPLPEIDFNAEMKEPILDSVVLGEAAPLADHSTHQPPATAAPAEPADPFSDAALFPGSNSVDAGQNSLAQKSTVEEHREEVVTESVQPEVAMEAETSEAVTPELANEAPPVDENPYSGLTLDSDPFSNPEQLRRSVPREIPPPGLSARATSERQPLLLTPRDEHAAEEPPLIVDSSEGDSGASSRQSTSEDDRTRAKQDMIASRRGMTGLKGFCPVALREDRDLVDAHSQYRAVYNSKTYYLSSSEAAAAFRESPSRYAPASRGSDVIHQAITGEELEGSLDYAVWYKGRLYLFSSAETMDSFVAAPSSHATRD